VLSFGAFLCGPALNRLHNFVVEKSLLLFAQEEKERKIGCKINDASSACSYTVVLQAVEKLREVFLF
jgi:hypothetical protein